jgi:HEAT repeat protein
MILCLCLLGSATAALPGQTEDASQLIAKLHNPDEMKRFEISQQLVAIGKPAVEPLIDALKDKDWRVRSGAAEALGNIKDARGVSPLLPLTKDLVAKVREAAVGALGQIRDLRATDALVIALKDRVANVRAEAAHSLGLMADPRAVGQLALNMKDPDNNARAEAADALVMFGPLAVDSLVALLKSPDINVRMSAGEALGYIGLGDTKDQRAIDVLLRALSEPNLAVVAGAHNFFIRRGVAHSEWPLISALNKYGDYSMASDYLNCGNVTLSGAAYDWAFKHGIKVESVDLGANSGTLGSGRWGNN